MLYLYNEMFDKLVLSIDIEFYLSKIISKTIHLRIFIVIYLFLYHFKMLLNYLIFFFFDFSLVIKQVIINIYKSKIVCQF